MSILMLYSIRIHRITTVTQFVWVPCVHDILEITTVYMEVDSCPYLESLEGLF